MYFEPWNRKEKKKKIYCFFPFLKKQVKTKCNQWHENALGVFTFLRDKIMT